MTPSNDDLTGRRLDTSYGWGAPGSPLRDEDRGPLLAGTPLRQLPIRPMFAWERAGSGGRRGEGAAGDYLAHLREARVSQLPRAQQVALKPVLFFERYGSSNPIPQEAPMTENVSITVTLTAPSFEDLAEVLLDVAEYDDVTVRPYRRPTIEHHDEPAPNYGGFVQARHHLVDTHTIIHYLTRICEHNARLASGQVEVTVEYVAEGTQERSTRPIIPVSVSDGRHLVLLDVRAGGVLKTFLLANIQSVDGPALESL